jgi:hypothetical protein
MRKREDTETNVMIQSTMPMRVKAKATSMNGKPRRKPRGLQSSHIFADSLLLCSPCDRDHKTDSSSAACFLKSSNSTTTRSFQDSKSLATSSGTWFAPLVAVLLPSRVIQWAKTKLLWISQTLSLSVSHTHTHTHKNKLSGSTTFWQPKPAELWRSSTKRKESFLRFGKPRRSWKSFRGSPESFLPPKQNKTKAVCSRTFS